MPNKKVECSRCKASKWTTEFDEGSFEEVTEESVCIFCKLREETLKLSAETQRLTMETQKLALENQELKARQEADRAYAAGLERIIENLIARSNGSPLAEESFTTLTPVIHSRREPPVEVEPSRGRSRRKTRRKKKKMETAEDKKETAEAEDKKETAEAEDKKETAEAEDKKESDEQVSKKIQIKEDTGNTSGNIEQVSKKIKIKDKNTTGNASRNTQRRKKNEQTSKNERPGTAVAGRGDPSASVTIIGDSQTRDMKLLMSARLCTSVDVKCLPGRGNRSVRLEAERSQMSETSVVALMVSGNDLYLKSGRVGSTDEIIRQVMGAVDDCGLKTSRRVVIGMLPRINSRRLLLERNRMVNERLQDMCTAEGVFFVDPYKHFLGRRDLYRWDGVHLSLKGKAELCNMVAETVRRTRQSVQPGRLTPRTYAPVTPEATFSEVVKIRRAPVPASKRSGNERA